MLNCGFRKGETLTLHWNDIDLENHINNILKSVDKGTEIGLYRIDGKLMGVPSHIRHINAIYGGIINENLEEGKKQQLKQLSEEILLYG